MSEKDGKKGKTLDKIASGVLDRGFKLAKLSVGLGMRTATHAITHAFSTEEEKLEGLKKLLLQQFQVLAHELGELKGSLMKAGQMLSVVGESFFPPEVVAVLRSLQSQSPPLAFSSLLPTLERELGERLLELEVDPHPVAAASLGQVHLAWRKKDPAQKIALKIQYPGVEAAIDGDLKILRRFLDLTKLFPSPGNLRKTEAIFSEVKEMLLQEVDYAKELALTDAYRIRLLADLPHPERYILPKTFPEYSGAKVIATEYEPGLEIMSPEVASLPQADRNQIAQSALELYLTELFRWRTVQTDPHFGNYRIRAPRALVLYDFGAVREFSPEFMDRYHRLVSAGFHGDSRALLRVAEDLGFLITGDSESYRQAFVELCQLICEPFLENRAYDWANSDLPKRVARKGAQLVFSARLRHPPREIVFLDRKMVGIFSLLKALAPNFVPRNIMEPFVLPKGSRLF